MDDVAQARTAQLEQRIADALAAFEGARGARVQLTLPRLTELPLDRPSPHPRALILLPEGARAPDDAVLATVVHSTLADDRAEVAVLRPPAPPAAEPLVRIGPFRVQASSARPLRLTLAVTFVTNALLALWVLAGARRHRPEEPKVDRGGRSRL